MKPPVDVQTAQPMFLRGAASREAALPATPRRAIPGAALKLLGDERLARLAAAGDRMAFAAIFDRHRAELYRYCTSILRNGDDAADALQNTMLRALNALGGRDQGDRAAALALPDRPQRVDLAAPAPASRWRATRRRCLRLKSTSRQARETRAQLTEVLDDIRELPERQRGALVMREMAGLEYSEIAAALATTPAGAKQAIYEARRALYELAKGREMECEAIQRTLSDGDGRAARGRAVRAHLRACAGCRDFGAAIRRASRSSRRSARRCRRPWPRGCCRASRRRRRRVPGRPDLRDRGTRGGEVPLRGGADGGHRRGRQPGGGEPRRERLTALGGRRVVSSKATPAPAGIGAPVAARGGPSAELRGERTGAPAERRGRSRNGARDERLSPAKPGKSRGSSPQSAGTVSAPRLPRRPQAGADCGVTGEAAPAAASPAPSATG